MYHLFYLLASVFTWVCILLSGLVSCLLQIPLNLLWFFDPYLRISGTAFRLCAISSIQISPLFHFRVYGPIPKAPTKPTVVISNHTSHLDSFLISFVPWEMKWLGKSSLFNVPFVGWAMRLAGHISIVRGDKKAATQAMEKCKRYIQAGVPVFIFPEGTRGPTQQMLPFRDGAFRLAMETGADILPLAVAGTRYSLPKKAFVFRPTTAVVTIGHPISSLDFQGKEDGLERFKAAARSQIEQMLDTIRPLSSEHLPS